MNRRGALAVLGGALFLGGTLGARAQPTTNVRRIGMLGPNLSPPPDEIQKSWVPQRALGWIEGQNLLVERRYAGGKPELLGQYAEELVRLNVEIIGTEGTAATIAAQNATNRIPIVMYSAGDPIRSGLVASLARPGGNVTGYSNIGPELDTKRAQILRELLPTAQRVAVLINPDSPYSEIVREERERVYGSTGLQPIIIAAARTSELENAVADAARRRAEALVIINDDLFWSNRVLLVRAAPVHQLPIVVGESGYVESGGLLSLANDDTETNRIFAYFVGKILRGAKPADLPIQRPTKFVLSINLKTAKALGLTVPQSLLLRADEVIQ